MMSFKKIGIRLICLSCLFYMSVLHASVIMTGTRVIFPAEDQDKSLQFSNNGDTPYLVQVWLDRGDDKSTPETANAPFIVNPQVFRVGSNSGQVSRLIYLGDGQLPNDRESIFYLNFKQVPAVTKESMETNRLVLLVRSRLKVFYRPKTIEGDVEDVSEKLTFSIEQAGQDTWVKVHNPTGYFVSVVEATVHVDEQEIKTKTAAMIEPKSTVRWQLEKNIPKDSKARLSIRFINDYGSSEDHDITLAP